MANEISLSIALSAAKNNAQLSVSISATQDMTAPKMASLVGKWRNSAPWVSPIRCAIAAVVMLLGFCSAARSTTASTVAARRSSAGRCLGCPLMACTRERK